MSLILRPGGRHRLAGCGLGSVVNMGTPFDSHPIAKLDGAPLSAVAALQSTPPFRRPAWRHQVAADLGKVGLGIDRHKARKLALELIEERSERICGARVWDDANVAHAAARNTVPTPHCSSQKSRMSRRTGSPGSNAADRSRAKSSDTTPAVPSTGLNSTTHCTSVMRAAMISAISSGRVKAPTSLRAVNSSRQNTTKCGRSLGLGMGCPPIQEANLCHKPWHCQSACSQIVAFTLT